jgi:hypothetical protein
MSTVWKHALILSVATICSGAAAASFRRADAGAGKAAMGLECQENVRPVAAARTCRP